MNFTTSFQKMSSAELLKAEQTLYAESWKATTRCTVTTAAGAVNGIATAGTSTMVTAPILAYRSKYLYDLNAQLEECSAQVRARRLESLGTAYGKIVLGGAITCTFGVIGCLIPGFDAAAESILSPVAEHVIEAAAESIAEDIVENHVVQEVIDRAEDIVEGTKDWLQHSTVVDTFSDVAACDLGDALAEALEPVQDFLSDNEELKDKLKTFLLNRAVEQSIGQLQTRIEFSVAPLYEYLARCDVEAYTRTQHETNFTAATIYGPAHEQTRGFWSWIGVSPPPRLPAELLQDVTKMGDEQLERHLRSLYTQSVEQLRKAYEFTALLVHQRNPTADQRCHNHLNVFVQSRALVLLHHDLEKCREVAIHQSIPESLLQNTRYASIAMIQAVAAMTQTTPTNPKIKPFFTPSPRDAQKTECWRDQHLDKQAKLVKRQVQNYSMMMFLGICFIILVVVLSWRVTSYRLYSIY